MIRRLMPDALAARLVLLLAMALLVANLVALVVLNFEQRRFDRQANNTREIERITALVPAMEAVDASVRQAIARDASTRVARVRVDPRPMLSETAPDGRSRDLARRLSATLEREDILVAVRERQPRGDTNDSRTPRFFRNGIIAISLPLSARDGDAQWLNIVTSGVGQRPEGVEQQTFLTVLALSLFSVLGVAIWLARRLSKPMVALADAATAAGRGDRSARVPETGAREMRAAATAFNAMQTQISQFEAERMRTLAAVGHDLRTPMTSLRIRAEMIDDDSLRSPIIRTLDEMTVMADGLVTYAKDGRDSEPTQTLDLSDIVDRIATDRGIAFAAPGPIPVQARPVGLTRVINNLIDNADRYGGGAQLTLGRDGVQAVLTIRDTGPGIPKDQLDSVFQPFQRGEASRSLETGGAGLGLSIARTIVNSFGGDIWLQNRDGGGLDAQVRLPVSKDAT